MSELPTYILERVFNAPRELVWKAWTNPEFLHHWYGPNIETTIHKFDLKPGGTWLNEMKWGENSDYSKMTFQEVVAPEKLVWHHSSSDSDWNVISSPMMENWPRVLLTTVTFEEQGDKTNVKLIQVPIDPTEAEITCFAQMMKGMDNGWGGGYEVMDQLLEDMLLESK